MKHEAVASSNIESSAHEGDVLEVCFKSGAVHRYHGVSRSDHATLMSAKSKGSHFAKHIRPRFKSTKVGDPPPRP